jgi:hypothetical protein
MNSPRIDVIRKAAQMRVMRLYAYHQSVDVGVIAVRRACLAAWPAEAGG